MKTLRLSLRLALIAVACASISACADNPPQQASLDYRTRPSPTMQSANSNPGSSGQRLTIQAGQGEKLNLPWFVRDAQGWVNSN
jgi:type IV pilus biogenesis protein CpaD/CtpE